MKEGVGIITTLIILMCVGVMFFTVWRDTPRDFPHLYKKRDYDA